MDFLGMVCTQLGTLNIHVKHLRSSKKSPAISPICREPDSPRTGKVTQPAMSDVQQLVIATWGHPNHSGGKDDFHWYVGILGRGNGWFHCKSVILRTWSKLWFEHETGGFKQGIKIGSWSWWEWKSHVLFMEIWRMAQVIGVSFLSASIRLHQLGPNSMVSGWLPLPIERINIILMIEHEFAYVIDLDPLWPNTSLGILTTVYIYIYIIYVHSHMMSHCQTFACEQQTASQWFGWILQNSPKRPERSIGRPRGTPDASRTKLADFFPKEPKEVMLP